jgi:delta 1-pyrroline-5-carboxylate dehydrogenase
MMRSVVYKVLTGAVVVGTLAFGGTALATTGTPADGTPPAAATSIVQPAADQSQPAPAVATETAGVAEVDTDNIQDENGADDATEVNAPETEGSEGAEVAESAELPGDLGHADADGGVETSGVGGIDHQFDGVE